MKIYTKVVIGMRSGEILEEESYEHDGDVALCKGGDRGGNEIAETSQEIEMSKITQEEWNRFKTTYQPLMKEMAGEIQEIGEAEKNTVAGMVGSGLTRSYNEAADQTAKNSFRGGVDPSSGRMSIGMGDVGRGRAESMAQGMVKGVERVEDVKVAGLQNIVGMARGDAGKSMRGLNSIATDAVNAANQKASFEQASRNDKAELGATVVGMGLAGARASGWGKAGAASTGDALAGSLYYDQNALPA